MAGIDIKRLRAMGKDIDKKSGGGGDLFLYDSKIPKDGEVEVRLLPPPEVANGIYFVEQAGWWVSGKFYLTRDTEIIGGEDIIQQEIDAARATGDEDLIALIDARNDKNMPVLKKQYRYMMPALQLEVKYDEDDEVESCKVEDYKVLVCKPTMLQSIHKLVTSRPYQNKTPEGIMNRVKGFNLILTKTGAGTDTKYGATGWVTPMEMDEKWYDEKRMPNVIEMTKKAVTSDNHLSSVIRNYLYGEDIVEDAKVDTKESPKLPEAKTKKPERAVLEPEEVVAPVKKAVIKKARSIVADVESSMDDKVIEDL